MPNFTVHRGALTAPSRRSFLAPHRLECRTSNAARAGRARRKRKHAMTRLSRVIRLGLSMGNAIRAFSHWTAWLSTATTSRQEQRNENVEFTEDFLADTFG